MSFCSEKNIIMLLTQLMKFTFRQQRKLIDVYVLYAAGYILIFTIASTLEDLFRNWKHPVKRPD